MYSGKPPDPIHTSPAAVMTTGDLVAERSIGCGIQSSGPSRTGLFDQFLSGELHPLVRIRLGLRSRTLRCFLWFAAITRYDMLLDLLVGLCYYVAHRVRMLKKLGQNLQQVMRQPVFGRFLQVKSCYVSAVIVGTLGSIPGDGCPILGL